MSWSVKNKAVVYQNIQCSFIQKPVIHLMQTVQAKLEALMNQYPHREWCSYLVGDKVNDGWIIQDLVVPPHEASEGGYCLAEPFHEPPACIGFLHSHHSIGAFHSGQDAHTVDKNYTISITVAKRAGQTQIEYAPLVNMETPCHQHYQSIAIISLVVTSVPLSQDWLTKAIANIDKPHKQVIPIHLPGTYIQPDTLAIPQYIKPVVRQLPSTTLHLHPFTVDKQGNLRDRLGHYAGKNKAITNPLDGHIYYMDEQGHYYTQQELEYLKKRL